MHCLVTIYIELMKYVVNSNGESMSDGYVHISHAPFFAHY